MTNLQTLTSLRLEGRKIERKEKRRKYREENWRIFFLFFALFFLLLGNLLTWPVFKQSFENGGEMMTSRHKVRERERERENV